MPRFRDDRYYDRDDYDRDRRTQGSEGGYRPEDYGGMRGGLGRDYEEGFRGRSGRPYAERGYSPEEYGRGRYAPPRADYPYDEGRRPTYREDYGRSGQEEGREYGRTGWRGRAGGSRSRLRCRDIMTKDMTVATRDTLVQDVAKMMRDEDTGIIPVVDREDAPAVASNAGLEGAPRINNRVRSNGKLVGLITDRDIVMRAIADGKDARTTLAEEIMTTDLHTAHPNDRVIDVIRKMGDKQVRRIPIVGENGNLRGIISMADLALETEEDRELADALEEISSGSSFWSKIFG